MEPVRARHRNLKFYEALCDGIDWKSKRLLCTSVLEDRTDHFDVPFDQLVMAVGGTNNTFGIPGVKENAHFLNDISDAR